MPPIPPEHMGDIWPAAEPGRASDYGSARLSRREAVEVRSFQTLSVTYALGRFGLDDTGAIQVVMRWVNDSGPLQTTDPAAMNYVTATASNGVPLEVTVEPHGFRPWNYGVRVQVLGGYMCEGDTITVTLGDRSAGGPGFRMQTIAESAFEIKVAVDACATGHFMPLADELHFPIVAGPVERFKLIGPGQRRPGEPFALGIKAEDRWGNPTPAVTGGMKLEADGPVDGLPGSVDLMGAALRIEGLTLPEPGVTRITLASDAGTALAPPVPVVVRDEPLAGYWGDLHGQSGESVGIGTIDEYLAFARDLAFLDVSGHQANDFQITNAFWKKINTITSDMNEDGKFVVFPGYEWSGNTPVGGDHNVFFAEEDRPIVRSSHSLLADRSDLDTDANDLSTLFEKLKDEDVVIWAHVGGRPADVAYAHDPSLKTAVEVHSNWGTFEWILTDSLALGHRIGVVANSDGHKGRPGDGAPGAAAFGAYGGLTCFLAPELTRSALFEAMRNRHHYGTSGARIGLDVRAVSPEAMMGDIVQTDADSIDLRVRVEAQAPIERVDLLAGAECVETVRAYGLSDLGRRLRVYWRGAEYRGRGRNTFWSGTVRALGGAFTSLTPIARWNPERPVVLTEDGALRFEAVTSGNFGGADLVLSEGITALEIETNHVSGVVEFDSLGLEDAVLDAGGLERQIVLRRLPDGPGPSSLDFTRTVPLATEETPIWVRVTTEDGHQAWSSPIYVLRTD